MKTKMNIPSLTKLAFTVCIVFMLNTAVFAQSKSGVTQSEAELAMARLENLMSTTEHDLRYVAPDDEVAGAFQNLDMLASATEKDLVYKAPDDEAPVSPENDNRMFSRRYRQPVQVETPVYTVQETWLINAGYYKSTKTPAWHNIKKTLRSKKVAKQYASSF